MSALYHISVIRHAKVGEELFLWNFFVIKELNQQLSYYIVPSPGAHMV